MTMRPDKRKSPDRKGWKFGSAADFLNLSDEELAFIDLKLALSRALKARRQKKRLSQTALAKAISSSQSRVAKMETGDPGVSLDLLVKSMLALGATRRDLANIIGRSNSGAPK
jgi:DNA-binding XRE family transcriptional regulator